MTNGNHLGSEGKEIEEFIVRPDATIQELITSIQVSGKRHQAFSANSIIPFTNHPNEGVRLQAIKTLGNLKSIELLDLFYQIAEHDCSTMVRREALSSIRRMRDPRTINKLISMLSQDDPKVVCQAIRGLLVFKGDKRVDDSLKPLINHPNEIVSSAIRKEYFSHTKKGGTIPHPFVYPFLKNVVVNADTLDVLTLLPEESLHLTFTSPPYYNARDYSIYQSYDAYLNFLKEVFDQVHRVTKEGRFLIVNTSPIIVPRISRQHQSIRYPIPFDLHTILVQLGWDFIDDIVWLKPEYSVKNRVGGFEQHRKPLGYKPNAVTEYLMVYRKHSERLLDWNMHQYAPHTVEESRVLGEYETTNAWTINPKSDKVHSAVFPEALCKRVIEYYSYKGDLVFDPFGGSGTLGRTARALGRFAFLTEKETKYFEYMKTFESTSSMFEERKVQFLSLEQFKTSIQI